ncbi:MAG: hypothetical protein JJT75_09335 [Opitutales bacterium]|nr:hypothetical protein [Opitutales bacterium]
MVLTTREFARMIKQSGVDFLNLPDEKMALRFSHENQNLALTAGTFQTDGWHNHARQDRNSLLINHHLPPRPPPPPRNPNHPPMVIPVNI